MVGNGRKVNATGGHLAIRYALTAFLSTATVARISKNYFIALEILLFTHYRRVLTAKREVVITKKKKKKPKTQYDRLVCISLLQ